MSGQDSPRHLGLIRPFIMTGGRTATTRPGLRWETLIEVLGDRSRLAKTTEQRTVLSLCGTAHIDCRIVSVYAPAHPGSRDPGRGPAGYWRYQDPPDGPCRDRTVRPNKDDRTCPCSLKTPNRHIMAVKFVIAGGFGVGKTTFVGAISEVEPLTTEAAMTVVATRASTTTRPWLRQPN